MGIRVGETQDQANKKLEATLAANGDVTAWIEVLGTFNVALFAAGTCILERSFDGGVTAVECKSLGSAVPFAGPCSEQLLSREVGLLHRLKRTAGAVALPVRISQ